jgi:hypothetical protein
MSTSNQPQGAYHKEPFSIQLKPVGGGAGEIWTVRLESEVLTLLRPGDTDVLQVHREEAARYVRFSYDLLRGRVVSFVVIEGLKSYSFHCTQGQMMKLLFWMPRVSRMEEARRIRYSGTGVALFGVLHVLLPQSLFWAWGILLLTVGVITVTLPRRQMYFFTGALLVLVGLWDLLAGTPAEFRAWAVPPRDRVVPVIVGSALVLWGVQQLSMLGPNQRLRAVRALRDKRVSFFPEESRVVRWIGCANVCAAVASGLYAAGTVTAAAVFPGGAGLSAVLDAANPRLYDLAAFGALCLLTALSAAVLFLRKRPAYTEAKVSAQMLIVALVFSMWGTIFSLWNGAPRAILGGVICSNLALFTKPYVWATLLVCVPVFNRWYARVVDRELEQQRG